MTFQIVVVAFGGIAFAALLLAAGRSARRGPRPGEWDGDDRRRARWRARSSAGFSDRGASGGA